MPLLLLLFLLMPLLLVMLFFNVATFSFAKLGLSTTGACFFLIASVIGSMINIPLSRRQVVLPQRASWPWSYFIFYYPPVVQSQTICLNVGGAGLPVLFSLYLLGTRAPIGPTVLAMLVVTIVTNLMARPQPGVGIVMPAFIPPLVAVVAALILAPAGHTAPVAYVAGAMGTLLGADLLNWRKIQGLGAQMVSIGGAGIFDGIFLVGIIAALLG